MKNVSRWFLLLIMPIFMACEPEAPDLEACKRSIPPSSLNATDREVIAELLQNQWYSYVISETNEPVFESFQNTGWNIDSATIKNANTRNIDVGFIGKNDFPEINIIRQFEYNCIGATLNINMGQALHYVQFSLPGYNDDSTQALVRRQDGSWEWFNSSCDMLLKKRNGVWQIERSLCIVQ